MKLKLVTPMIAGLWLGACASNEQYEQMVRGWVGRDVTDLVQTWGAPQQAYKSSDGNMVYVYRWSGLRVQTTGSKAKGLDAKSSFDGRLFTPSWNSNRANTKKLSCKTSFEVAVDDIIRSINWKGNYCHVRP